MNFYPQPPQILDPPLNHKNSLHGHYISCFDEDGYGHGHISDRVNILLES